MGKEISLDEIGAMIVPKEDERKFCIGLVGVPEGYTVEFTGQTGQISDGYHTFDELYEHRYLLFLVLLDIWKEDCDWQWTPWKSKTHWQDGKLVPVWDGWFVAGMNTVAGQVTYHLPIKYWDKCNVEELKEAPSYDGHTSQDVLKRFEAFLEWEP